MKKIPAIFITILALIIMASGCAGMGKIADLDQNSESNTNQGIDNVSTEDKGPAQGGYLNLFMIQPDTLNPLTSGNQTVHQLSSFIFDGLFCEKEDGTMENVLADSYSLSQEGSILDIKLKDNIFFHDGQKLTSDDVAYSVETIKRAGSKSQYLNNVAGIQSIKVLDRLNLRIILEKPENIVRKLTFPVIAEHIFKNWPTEGVNNDLKPVGTGPFKFDSYKDNKIRLVRNESWWNLTDNGLSHPVWFDGIIFRVYSDESGMMQAFLKKEIDIAYLEEGNIDDYTNRSDIFIKQYESNILEFLALSGTGRTGSPISQENFRAILTRYLKWYADSEPLSIGKPAEGYQAGIDSTGGVDRQSILKSLEEAGFIYKADENVLLFNKNGTKTPVTLYLKYNGMNIDRQTASEWIKTALFKIGIEVVTENASYSEEQSLVKSGKYDMMLLGCRLQLFADKNEIVGMVKKNIGLEGQNSVILPLYTKYGAVLYHNRIRGDKMPLWQNIYNGWQEWYIVE